jgi:tetratricopeptide (TPR) repeat protein
VLLANGFDRQALDCLGRAERLDPREPCWPYLQAWRLLVIDRDQGIEPLRRAVQLCDQYDRANTTPRVLLGEALMEQDEQQEAEAEWRRVLAQEPDNPRAHFDLGMLALSRDDLKAAADHLRRAADSPFTRQKACAQLAAVWRRLGKEADAADSARRASEPPADLPWNDPYVAEFQRRVRGRQGRFLEVEQLEQVGRLPEGIRLLYQVAEDFPDARSHVALGVALAKVKDYDAAEQALRAAVRLDPEKVQSLFALSVVLLRQGEDLEQRGGHAGAREKWREALACARKATELKPDHALAWIYLGLAQEKLGERTEAIGSFRRAVLCRPELVDGHLYLGTALAEDGQKAAALSALQAAIELAPPEDRRPREALDRLRKEGKLPL